MNEYYKILWGNIMFEFLKDKWKEKAVIRNREIKELKKRIKELENSRNNWKDKASKLNIENKKILIELKKN